MNYIGLDISKVSTAMVIETNNTEYWFSYNNKKLTNKWNKELINEGVKIYSFEYMDSEDYSASEINKLDTFIQISEQLIRDCQNTINKKEETIIYIEGYSYGKDSSAIIDLVGIGGLVRSKVRGIPNSKIKIIAPTSLKSMACELVYGFSEKKIGGKNPRIEKVINQSHKGITGGNFKKPDLFEACFYYDEFKNLFLYDYLSKNKEEILKLSTFPKPLEDLQDAWWLKEISKNFQF